jgi:alpha-ketoglutarate-dependent 2,4-dichlorophenoxyacetate dioxygenase
MQVVNQLHPRFVGEITGLDTSAPVAPETIGAFEGAMAKYAVCVIRNASLRDEDHIRFSRAFGPLELPLPGRGRIAPELFDSGNLDANGEIIPFNPNAKAQPADFELFHTDSAFNSLPTKWSFLLAHEHDVRRHTRRLRRSVSGNEKPDRDSRRRSRSFPRAPAQGR